MEGVGVEEDQGCKVCGKRFPCGRSLGGHMRSHFIAFSDPKMKRKKKKKSRSPAAAMSDEADEEVAMSLLLLSKSSSRCSDYMELKKVRNGLFGFRSQTTVMKHKCDDETEAKQPPPLMKQKPNSGDSQGKFRCMICLKSFSSYQALGGHRASHRIKATGSSSPQTKYPINEDDNNNNRRKGHHPCLICFRVFPSGQALGGHKRSHFITENNNSSNNNNGRGVSEASDSSTVFIRHFFDLNMPPASSEGDEVEEETFM